jgi:hypothetical protein
MIELERTSGTASPIPTIFQRILDLAAATSGFLNLLYLRVLDPTVTEKSHSRCRKGGVGEYPEEGKEDPRRYGDEGGIENKGTKVLRVKLVVYLSFIFWFSALLNLSNIYFRGHLKL